MKSLKQLLNAKGHHVHSIRPDAKVIEALQLMAQKDIGALLVTDAGRVVGILSERDYARKVILQGKSSHDIPVREIMTSGVVTVDPSKRSSQSRSRRSDSSSPTFTADLNAVWRDRHRR